MLPAPPELPPPRFRRSAGWLAVTLNGATASLWALWGAVEMFHEGWWRASLLENLAFAPLYLAPAAIFIALGLLGVLRPHLGALAMLAFTAWFWWWWEVPRRLVSGEQLLLGLVLSGAGGWLACLWWWGRVEPRRWALHATWLAPLVVALAAGAFPGWRALTRQDDGGRGERLVVGRDLELLWVGAGPGWPGRGASWFEAHERVARLAPEGDRLLEFPLHAWRLPTRDEVVRSLSFRGQNAGGTLAPDGASARYRVLPDKETPLWDPRSEVIYWWTADELGGEQAWSVCYNGTLLPRRKAARMGTLGFRAVRAANPESVEITPSEGGAR